MRALLLLPCLLSTLARFSPSQKPEDAAALAGVWEGTEAIESTGNCQIDTRGPAATKVLISVDGDGRLHARRTQPTSLMWPGADGSAPSPAPPIVRSDEPEWTGRLIGDRMEFELPQMGYCRGTANPNNYTMKLEGPLSTTKKGQRQLRLTGEDRPCPSMGCTFHRTLTLTWKRARP